MCRTQLFHTETSLGAVEGEGPEAAVGRLWTLKKPHHGNRFLFPGFPGSFQLLFLRAPVVGKKFMGEPRSQLDIS